MESESNYFIAEELNKDINVQDLENFFNDSTYIL